MWALSAAVPKDINWRTNEFTHHKIFDMLDCATKVPDFKLSCMFSFTEY